MSKLLNHSSGLKNKDYSSLSLLTSINFLKSTRSKKDKKLIKEMIIHIIHDCLFPFSGKAIQSESRDNTIKRLEKNKKDSKPHNNKFQVIHITPIYSQ
jgi:hypothetical protein